MLGRIFFLSKEISYIVFYGGVVLVGIYVILIKYIGKDSLRKNGFILGLKLRYSVLCYRSSKRLK